MSHSRRMNANPHRKILPALCALIAFALAPLAAQDVTIGTPVTCAKGDEDPEPLKLLRSPKPAYPASWRDTSNYGYVIVLSPTERETKYKDTRATMYASLLISGCTHQEIYNACRMVVGDWSWEKAAFDKNDPRRAWVAVIFNPAPASASGSKKDTVPRLLEITPVFLPTVLRMAKEDRIARADVTVGATGEIKGVKITSTQKYEKETEDAIVDAVSKWKIAPARDNGVPIEATINVPVLLLRSVYKSNSAAATRSITQLKPITQIRADYPESLGRRLEHGDVTLEFTLNDNGRPKNPVVVLSTNKKFDESALDAIRQYRFKKPDPSEPDSLGNAYEQLSDARWQYVVHVSFLHASARPLGENISRPVLPPESVKPVAPVYPYQLLKGNVTGSATVRMFRHATGSNRGPNIIEATHDSFGLALAAATHFYKVTPGRTIKREIAAAMVTATFDFNPANPDLRLPEKTLQLLADETNHPEKIITEDKLDRRLKTLKAPPAPDMGDVYINTALKGTAVIEFLVDETGRVHLPRILMTEAPEAAYVLVQQISMTVYDPPTQNGHPVVARVRKKATFDAARTLSADDK